MATLHVRNVPSKLYKRIQRLAQEENCSLTAEVIRLLGQGLQVQETRRGTAAVIERIRDRARKAHLPPNWVNSADLIREDRSR